MASESASEGAGAVAVREIEPAATAGEAEAAAAVDGAAATPGVTPPQPAQTQQHQPHHVSNGTQGGEENGAGGSGGEDAHPNAGCFRSDAEEEPMRNGVDAEAATREAAAGQLHAKVDSRAPVVQVTQPFNHEVIAITDKTASASQPQPQNSTGMSTDTATGAALVSRSTLAALPPSLSLAAAWGIAERSPYAALRAPAAGATTTAGSGDHGRSHGSANDKGNGVTTATTATTSRKNAGYGVSSDGGDGKTGNARRRGKGTRSSDPRNTDTASDAVATTAVEGHAAPAGGGEGEAAEAAETAAATAVPMDERPRLLTALAAFACAPAPDGAEATCLASTGERAIKAAAEGQGHGPGSGSTKLGPPRGQRNNSGGGGSRLRSPARSPAAAVRRPSAALSPAAAGAAAESRRVISSSSPRVVAAPKPTVQQVTSPPVTSPYRHYNNGSSRATSSAGTGAGVEGRSGGGGSGGRRGSSGSSAKVSRSGRVSSAPTSPHAAVRAPANLRSPVLSPASPSRSVSPSDTRAARPGAWPAPSPGLTSTAASSAPSPVAWSANGATRRASVSRSRNNHGSAGHGGDARPRPFSTSAGGQTPWRGPPSRTERFITSPTGIAAAERYKAGGRRTAADGPTLMQQLLSTPGGLARLTMVGHDGRLFSPQADSGPNGCVVDSISPRQAEMHGQFSHGHGRQMIMMSQMRGRSPVAGGWNGAAAAAGRGRNDSSGGARSGGGSRSAGAAYGRALFGRPGDPMASPHNVGSYTRGGGGFGLVGASPFDPASSTCISGGGIILNDGIDPQTGKPCLAYSRRPRAVTYTPYSITDYKAHRAKDADMLKELMSPGALSRGEPYADGGRKSSSSGSRGNKARSSDRRNSVSKHISGRVKGEGGVFASSPGAADGGDDGGATPIGTRRATSSSSATQHGETAAMRMDRPGGAAGSGDHDRGGGRGRRSSTASGDGVTRHSSSNSRSPVVAAAVLSPCSSPHESQQSHTVATLQTPPPGKSTRNHNQQHDRRQHEQLRSQNGAANTTSTMRRHVGGAADIDACAEDDAAAVDAGGGGEDSRRDSRHHSTSTGGNARRYSPRPRRGADMLNYLAGIRAQQAATKAADAITSTSTTVAAGRGDGGGAASVCYDEDCDGGSPIAHNSTPSGVSTCTPASSATTLGYDVDVDAAGASYGGSCVYAAASLAATAIASDHSVPEWRTHQKGIGTRQLYATDVDDGHAAGGCIEFSAAGKRGTNNAPAEYVLMVDTTNTTTSASAGHTPAAGRRSTTRKHIIDGSPGSAAARSTPPSIAELRAAAESAAAPSSPAMSQPAHAAPAKFEGLGPAGICDAVTAARSGGSAWVV